MMKTRGVGLVLLILVQMSCAMVAPPPGRSGRAAATTGAEQPERATPGPLIMGPEESEEAAQALPPELPRAQPEPASPPAVLALMHEAENDRSAGQLDAAAATLERAIRIQPSNPRLWQQLAALRLEQHQPGLAEDLAKKSNLLAAGNFSVIEENWLLIAKARRLRGDESGAVAAETKARRF